MPSEQVDILLRAENEELKRKLDETSRKLDELRGKSDGEAITTGMKRSVQAVTSFIGSIVSAIGVATVFYNLGNKIGETLYQTFASGTAQAEKFVEALDLTKPAQSIAATRKEIETLEAKLADALKRYETLDGGTSLQGAGRVKRLQDQLVTLRGIERDLSNQIEADKNATKKRLAEKAADEEFRRASEDSRKLAAQSLDEFEAIERAREDGILRAAELTKRARTDEQRAIAEELDRQVRLRAERENQLIRDRRAAEEQAATDAARERERREIEANRRIAEDMAEQMARALQDAYARGNAELLAGVNQVNSKLTVTANNILTVVRQLYANQPTGGR